LVASLSLALGACAGDDQEPASGGATKSNSGGDKGGPVKIGVVATTSGPYALGGNQNVEGMKVAVEKINADGGVLGKKIELDIQDPAADPTQAVTVTRKLLSDGVNALTGSVSSDDAIPMVNAAKNTVPLAVTMGSGTSIAEQNNPNVVQMNCSSPAKELPIMNYIGSESGATKVAMLLQNNEFGKSVLAQYKEAWKNGGPKIVYEGLYQASTTDFSALVARAKSAGADGLYVAGATQQYIKAFQQAAQIGFKPKVRWLAGEAVQPASLKLNSKAIDGVITGNVYNPFSDDPVNQEFVKAYQAATGETPGWFSVLGYDSIMVLAEAMKAANSVDDKDKISAAMRTVNYSGPRGPVTLAPDSPQDKCQAKLTKVVNGKLEYIQ
jgi:branched-chain amino acid transport system substrate-binding protein